MSEHTRVYALVNVPRRCFAWLDAKKDEKGGGCMQVRAAHKMSLPSIFKAKKEYYIIYSHKYF